jgi:hypothetical protein
LAQMTLSNKVTVVCASKGGDTIKNLLASFVSANFIPKSVIIVVPVGQIIYFSEDDYPLKIRFLESALANQVLQRMIAISMVTTEYILQIDDDVIVSSDFGERINTALSNKEKNELIGCELLAHNGRPLCGRWTTAYQKNALIRLYCFITSGFKKIDNYSITLAGRIIPRINPQDSPDCQPRWCSSTLLYPKECLIDAKFLIRKGKSYYEDVYFVSSLLRTKKYTLKLVPELKVYHPVVPPISLRVLFDTLPNQYEVMKITNGSTLIFLLDVLAWSLYLSALRLINYMRRTEVTK